MIKNERQYRISKAQVDKFKSSLEKVIHSEDMKNDKHPALIDAQMEALESQYEELLNEVKQYEALQAGEIKNFEAMSFEELPQILIKARIASGLTHYELAEKVGLKEQQIQRYEASDYSKASLSRIKEIVNALDINIKEEIFLSNTSITITNIIEKLSSLGFDKDFIKKRLIPSDLIPSKEKTKSNLTFKVASYLSKIFGFPISSFVTEGPLELNLHPFITARFKTAKKVDDYKLVAYTIYAHKLALLTHFATDHIEQKEIPTDPKQVRSQVLQKFGRLTFENTLKYVWSLGIPVLPLNDSGAFHGASWRFEGKNILVIKQKHMYHARWLYDLIHELRHAAESPEDDHYEVIETSPIEPGHHESEEEQTADYFAEDVIMDSRSKEIEEACVSRAQGSVEKLKNAVIEIAEKEGIEVDSLANHLAYRLSQQNINWWGAATNLQISEPNPWDLAKSLYFQHVDLYSLNQLDRKFLINALSN